MKHPNLDKLSKLLSKSRVSKTNPLATAHDMKQQQAQAKLGMAPKQNLPKAPKAMGMPNKPKSFTLKQRKV